MEIETCVRHLYEELMESYYRINEELGDVYIVKNEVLPKLKHLIQIASRCKNSTKLIKLYSYIRAVKKAYEDIHLI